ncbi:hypothetical protein F7734_07675 [Scytonema sp. UIC 10036]|nr:hypothetical protein [Scytonema sp. UIC 10036]MUG92340.1 hypothetical protein [Scytonema sp. UIC 10036]
MSEKQASSYVIQEMIAFWDRRLDVIEQRWSYEIEKDDMLEMPSFCSL